jgi:hypothetical protein
LGGLKANPLPWLLEEDDPSVRYFTLVDILGLPPRDKLVVAAKILKALAEIPEKKRAPEVRRTIENTYNGRFQVDIEKKGEPSKWVTLLALKALKPCL